MCAIRIHQVRFLVEDVVHVGVRVIQLNMLILQLKQLELHLAHTIVVVIWHREPRMFKNLLGAGTIFRAPLKNGHEKISHSGRLLRLKEVAID